MSEIGSTDGADLLAAGARGPDGEHSTNTALANAIVQRLERIAAHDMVQYPSDGAMLTQGPRGIPTLLVAMMLGAALMRQDKSSEVTAWLERARQGRPRVLGEGGFRALLSQALLGEALARPGDLTGAGEPVDPSPPDCRRRAPCTRFAYGPDPAVQARRVLEVGECDAARLALTDLVDSRFPDGAPNKRKAVWPESSNHPSATAPAMAHEWQHAHGAPKIARTISLRELPILLGKPALALPVREPRNLSCEKDGTVLSLITM